MAIITPSMVKLADKMKRHAETGLYHGLESEMRRPYFNNAGGRHDKTGTVLIFTRDTGHHSSGWFKNPDYERCYHLSISFWSHDKETSWDMVAWQEAPYNPALAKVWCHAFYGDWVRFIWDESNKTHHNLDDDIRWQDIANKHEIHHYRVFCDLKWKPIIPRGEVYTRDFTEKGWKSWSEQQAIGEVK